MIGRIGIALIAAASTTITRCQNDHRPFPASPPDIVNIVMTPGQTIDQMRTACDDMGGADLTTTDGVIFTCESVDY